MAFLLDLIGGAMQYEADKAQAKAARAWQAYSNKMVDLSNSVSQNALTRNQMMTADAFTNQAVQLRTDSMFTQSQIEVSAAAAGVKGGSVTRVLRQSLRDSVMRENERQEQFQNAMLGIEQQRLNATMSAAMQKDYSYIPKPKFASYFLNAVSKNSDKIMSAFTGGMA